MPLPEAPAFDSVVTAGKVAGAIVGVVGLIAGGFRVAKWCVRTAVLWAVAADVKVERARRNGQYAALMESLGEVQSQLELLSPVAESVRFIERALIEKGLGGAE